MSSPSKSQRERPTTGKKKQDDDKTKKKSKLELSDLEALRLGGVYIPPFKMRQIEAKLSSNKKSEAYQRLQWEALRKSINGPVNKVNKHNITEIVVELFNENIIRGRGLLCRSLMKSQLSSPNFTNVYCALICIINTKIPEIGDLLCRRIIAQFQRSYKRNDKLSLKCIVKFIAHLINYQVLHELCGLQIIQLLLTEPTNDSIEIVKELILNVGNILNKLAPDAMKAVFNTLKDILQESNDLDVRVQYELESLFNAFKTNFQVQFTSSCTKNKYHYHLLSLHSKQKKDHPAIEEDLDLVDEDDIICHNINLLGQKDTEKMLNIFHYDPEWDKHEEDYQDIKREILGEDDDDDSDSDTDSDDDEDGKPNASDDTDSDSDSDSDSDESEQDDMDEEDGDIEIADLTNENVMNLRRKIYLTMVSSLTAEEMAHKIMKKFSDSYKNVSHMILEACAHERSYRKQYGLLAERLSKLKTEYEDCFDELFVRQYNDIHLLDTNKIRNVSKFFAHLLYSNALDWTVMEFIKLNERDTNPSKRIFIKILFQELASFMGSKLRQELFDDNNYGKAFDGLFPMGVDANPKDTRFAINFFTTIGLGGLTEEMRTFLKQKHKDMIKQQQAAMESSDDSDSDSDSDSTDTDSSSSSESESDSSSESEDERRHRRKKRKRPRKRDKENDKRDRKRRRRHDRNKDKDEDEEEEEKDGRDHAKRHRRDGRERDDSRDRTDRRERKEDEDRDRRHKKDKRDRDRDRYRENEKERRRDRDTESRRMRRKRRTKSVSRSRSRSRSRHSERSRSGSRGRWGS